MHVPYGVDAIATIREWIPLGRAGVVLAIVTLLAAVVAALRPVPAPADLTVWTFADTYYKAFSQPGEDGRSPVEVFEARTGLTVNVKLIDRQAMDVRLLAGGDVADVVQLELSAAAKLLDRPGGVPLQPWPDPAVADRSWQRDGVTYALPMDVHPVAWAYRIDLFEEAGVDIASAATWPDFVDAARRYQQFMTERGLPHRRTLELTLHKSDHLTLLLQQRQIPPTDLGNSVTQETIDFLAGLHREGLAGPVSAGHGRWSQDFAAGDVAILWMPDWRLKYLELSAPSLAGKVGLMRVPTTAGQPAVATWGGTALAVPTTANQRATELADFLATSPESLAARQRATYIIPAAGDLTPSTETYVAGVDPRQFYRDLAVDTDRQPVTAATLEAWARLARRMSNAVTESQP